MPAQKVTTSGGKKVGAAVLAEDATTSNWTGAKQFTYVRYDPAVCQPDLDALGLANVKAENVQVMDSVKHIADIRLVGAAYAKKYVSLNHLQPFCATEA